jgi:hypothetical protein
MRRQRLKFALNRPLVMLLVIGEYMILRKLSDASINNMLRHFAFVEMKFSGTTNVNFDAILTDPAFRVAAEQHLSSQLGRFINIRVSQSKIIQIQELIDQELGVAATSTEDSF